MRTLTRLLSVAAVSCAFWISGQDSIRGPVLGLSYDPAARALRPIQGIAGASTLGERLVPDRALIRTFVSPGGAFALAESDAEDNLILISLSTPDPVSVPAQRGAAIVAFSASSTSAALLYSDPPRIVVMRRISDSPEVLEIDGDSLPGEIRSLAVNDDGTAVLAGVMQEGQGAVYAIQAGGAYRFLFALGDPSSLALFNSGKDAVVVDRAAGRVLLARGIDGVPVLSDFTYEESDFEGPFHAAISRDGNSVVVLGDRGGIFVVRLGEGAQHVLRCRCQPAALTRLGGNAIFRLDGWNESPVLILDGDAPIPRVVFVPPPPADGTESGGEDVEERLP